MKPRIKKMQICQKCKDIKWAGIFWNGHILCIDCAIGYGVFSLEGRFELHATIPNK